MQKNYIVVRCSLHEDGAMALVGRPFANYDEAEKAMEQDMEETASGWNDVDPDDVDIDDNSVSYEDERFVWAILPID